MTQGLLVAWWLIVCQTVLSQGRVAFEGNIPSQILGGKRRIHVYSPPSYERKPRWRFPVLYLPDGQNIFSTARPHAALGGRG